MPRNLELLDEEIHMAGACQLAGFPTVIGTLWQVQDQYSPTISETLYQTMLGEDGTLDIQKAAKGLQYERFEKIHESERSKAGEDRRIAWHGPPTYM
jgi:hypothetical protein